MVPEYSTESFQCGSRCLTNPTIYEGLAKELEAAIESVVTCLYIGGVERDRAVWRRHDRRARERSQAKSTL